MDKYDSIVEPVCILWLIFNFFWRINDETLYFNLLIVYLMNYEINTWILCVYVFSTRFHIRWFSINCDLYIIYYIEGYSNENFKWWELDTGLKIWGPKSLIQNVSSTSFTRPVVPFNTPPLSSTATSLSRRKPHPASLTPPLSLVSSTLSSSNNLAVSPYGFALGSRHFRARK